ncbi:MAG: hypothetical protein PVH48_09585 [Cyclobacteriaceae bacterium]|jgi:hypothetical protein
MKKVSYLILLIVTVTFSMSMASGNEGEGSALVAEVSTAELEFVNQIDRLNEICLNKLDNIEECLPKVIVMDRDCNIIAAGVRANYIIDQLIPTSNFLTNVQGTDYYSLNFRISEPVKMLITNR